MDLPNEIEEKFLDELFDKFGFGSLFRSDMKWINTISPGVSAHGTGVFLSYGSQTNL